MTQNTAMNDTYHPIPDFPGYSVNKHGDVRSERSKLPVALVPNKNGEVALRRQDKTIFCRPAVLRRMAGVAAPQPPESSGLPRGAQALQAAQERDKEALDEARLGWQASEAECARLRKHCETLAAALHATEDSLDRSRRAYAHSDALVKQLHEELAGCKRPRLASPPVKKRGRPPNPESGELLPLEFDV